MSKSLSYEKHLRYGSLSARAFKLSPLWKLVVGIQSPTPIWPCTGRKHKNETSAGRLVAIELLAAIGAMVSLEKCAQSHPTLSKLADCYIYATPTILLCNPPKAGAIPRVRAPQALDI